MDVNEFVSAVQMLHGAKASDEKLRHPVAKNLVQMYGKLAAAVHAETSRLDVPFLTVYFDICAVKLGCKHTPTTVSFDSVSLSSKVLKDIMKVSCGGISLDWFPLAVRCRIALKRMLATIRRPDSPRCSRFQL